MRRAAQTGSEEAGQGPKRRGKVAHLEEPTAALELGCSTECRGSREEKALGMPCSTGDVANSLRIVTRREPVLGLLEVLACLGDETERARLLYGVHLRDGGGAR